MKEESLQRTYACLVAALFVVVALWRHDLVEQAWRVTCATWAVGGWRRWRLAGEVVLFGGILAMTWRSLPRQARPAHDLAVFLIATAAGCCVEAWGTRLGVWTYYTGERPPLWIVPAWPLGAALIERSAALARSRAGEVPAAGYWLLSLLMLAAYAGLGGPWLGRPAGWLGALAVAAGLLAGNRPQEDFWVLACGLPCIFFADLWGTTNGCWSYPLIAAHGTWRGIGFGMVLDTAVVAGCLKLARRAAR